MPPETPHILIAGAGALGSLFGGLLAEAGSRVTLFSRRKDHIEAVRRLGLRIVGEGGDRAVRVAATDSVDQIPQADIVIVLCKSTATADICQELRPVIGHEAVAVSFQNGLGNEDIMATAWGAGMVIGGLTSMGATLEEPGLVRSYATLPTLIGELDGVASERVERLATLLTTAQLPTIATSSFLAAKWQKLLMNVAMSATSGLTGLTIGEVAAHPELSHIARRAIDEAAQVAKAEGVMLDQVARHEVLDSIINSGAARNKTSMRRDIEAARPTEVGAIYGSIITRAQQYRIATPTLEALAALMRGLEQATIKAQRAP